MAVFFNYGTFILKNMIIKNKNIGLGLTLVAKSEFVDEYSDISVLSITIHATHLHFVNT